MDDGGQPGAGPQPGARAGRPGRGPGPDRLAGRGGGRARGRGARPGCPAPGCCSSWTSRRCPPRWAAGAERERAEPGPAGRGGDAESGLRDGAVRRAAATVVHCCGMSAPLGIIRSAARTGRGSTSACSAGGRKRCWPRRSRLASGSSWARYLPRRRQPPARQHQPAGRGPTAPLPPLLLRNETRSAPSPRPSGSWNCGGRWGGRRPASPVLQRSARRVSRPRS